ncbi:MAG: outer membrane lipoprotein-sorting protein [Deltaproteobacteria bacterium]|nr:MAG: outer membrane lipoprotein-sorting protein [Deltaproteobacteria bacterium]
MTRKVAIMILSLTLTSAVPVLAQTADEIVAKHVAAMGGKERIDAVKTLKLSGKVNVNGMEAPYVLMIKRPSSMRMDTEMQGQKLTQAYDGTNAWMQMGGRTMQMPPQAAAKMGEQTDLAGPLVDYESKGHTVELVGKEDVDGKPAFHLKLTKKDGEVSDIYLDAKSYLEVKRVEKRKGMNGAEMEVTTWLGNYEKVGGIPFPHTVKMAGGPQQVEQKFEKIEIDLPLDDALFKMPADAQQIPARPHRR